MLPWDIIGVCIYSYIYIYIHILNHYKLISNLCLATRLMKRNVQGELEN